MHCTEWRRRERLLKRRSIFASFPEAQMLSLGICSITGW